MASISWKGVGKGFGEKEGCSSKNLYTGCYSGIGRRTDKGWAWRSARFLWYWLQPPIQVHKQGQIYPSPRLHPPPSLSHLLFPIQRSPPRFHPLSHFYPPIFFLLSTLLPRFATHRHFLLAYFFPRKLAHLWAKQNNWGTIALTYRSSWFRQWNEKRSGGKGRSCGSFSNYLETTGLIRRIVAFFKSVILFIVIERDKWGERGKDFKREQFSNCRYASWSFLSE